VCIQLGGIPLAIELAAALLPALSIQQVAQELDDVLRLLVRGNRGALPRQQTLRATVAWSYDLLDPQERLLFDRLSMFAGGWSLDAAEAACAEPEDTGSAVRLCHRDTFTIPQSTHARRPSGRHGTSDQPRWERGTAACLSDGSCLSANRASARPTRCWQSLVREQPT